MRKRAVIALSNTGRWAILSLAGADTLLVQQVQDLVKDNASELKSVHFVDIEIPDGIISIPEPGRCEP